MPGFNGGTGIVRFNTLFQGVSPLLKGIHKDIDNGKPEASDLCSKQSDQEYKGNIQRCCITSEGHSFLSLDVMLCVCVCARVCVCVSVITKLLGTVYFRTAFLHSSFLPKMEAVLKLAAQVLEIHKLPPPALLGLLTRGAAESSQPIPLASTASLPWSRCGSDTGCLFFRVRLVHF